MTHDELMAKYSHALGVFRQEVRNFCTAARGLNAAAQALDPEGTLPTDPMVARIVEECEAELRSVCDFTPGMRHLLRAASNGGKR